MSWTSAQQLEMMEKTRKTARNEKLALRTLALDWKMGDTKVLHFDSSCFCVNREKSNLMGVCVEHSMKDKNLQKK